MYCILTIQYVLKINPRFTRTLCNLFKCLCIKPELSLWELCLPRYAVIQIYSCIICLVINVARFTLMFASLPGSALTSQWLGGIHSFFFFVVFLLWQQILLPYCKQLSYSASVILLHS